MITLHENDAELCIIMLVRHEPPKVAPSFGHGSPIIRREAPQAASGAATPPIGTIQSPPHHHIS